MSLNLSSSLLPSPVSTRTSPASCSTRRQRSAKGIRLRSSAGMRRCHRGFGTTPNMAPPSRRWVPPSRAWQVRRPTLNVVWGTVAGPVVQEDQVFERLHPAFPRAAKQGTQDVGGGERIPEGAMTCRVVHAEERRHLVESTVAQLGQEAAGEADRAEGLTAGRGADAGRGAFGREEAPVEAGVVGDEHACIERPSEAGGDVAEPGATGDQAGGDTGEAR